MNKKRKKNKSVVWWVLSFLILSIAAIGYFSYDALYSNNIQGNIKSHKILYLKSETSSKELSEKLLTSGIIHSEFKFKLSIKIKRFKQNIKPGKYKIAQGMSNSQILNMFLARNQTPTTITFNNIRTKYELASRLGSQLLADSAEIIQVLTNDALLQKNKLNSTVVTSIFIPDTYEVYWTISAEELLYRMIRESDKFWTESRISKANNLKLTRAEVITLASIVEEETKNKTEKPIVAGLYINRLRKGYLLQADPTLKFALNDFGRKRLLNADKKIESPYNTYKYKGLPPGPIRIPEKSSIDAVLNYKQHNYLYMCAKEDFSGLHNFATNLVQHNRYAAKYRRALNKRRIYQ